MNYIAEIEYQIEVMRKYNESAKDSGIAMSISMMAEKAFYMSIKDSERGKTQSCMQGSK